jgi:citrate lyase synthetase
MFAYDMKYFAGNYLSLKSVPALIVYQKHDKEKKNKFQNTYFKKAKPKKKTVIIQNANPFRISGLIF